MGEMLSERITRLRESGTVKFTPLIEKLREKGKDIINFAIGEPDFPTPEPIVEATIRALRDGKTKYGVVSGIKELKLALCEKLRRENGIECNEDNLIITNGSKQGLFMVIHVLCNKGDEVIIPRPLWMTYKEQVKFADARPVIVDTKENFELDVDAISNAITERTKAIIINTPNNPSGAVFSKRALKEVADIALENRVIIITDETYEKFVYDGLKHYSIASFGDEIREITITVNSFSKSYCMTGFRVGYVAASEEIIAQMVKLQGHLTTNVCTFAQYGALEALRMDQSIIREMVSEFEKRRNLAFRLASKLFDCAKPRGAFYVFPNISDRLNKRIKTSEELAMYVLEKAGVVMVPGEVFGTPNHVRIAFTCSKEKIKEGFERMEKIL